MTRCCEAFCAPTPGALGFANVTIMAALTRHDDVSVVVYDLDGVITRKDSFTAFVGERLRRAPLRLLPVVPAVGLMALGTRPGRRRRIAHRITEIALAGLNERDYGILAAAFGHRIGRDPAWVRAEAVQRLRQQHAAGVRIVVATASERRLAEALLASAGVPYDVLSASVLTGTSTGMKVVDHRVGVRKVEALREQRIPLKEAEFVTDSVTDLPTARAAARVVLVGASLRTRDRYVRAGIVAVPQTSRSCGGAR